MLDAEGVPASKARSSLRRPNSACRYEQHVAQWVSRQLALRRSPPCEGEGVGNLGPPPSTAERRRALTRVYSAANCRPTRQRSQSLGKLRTAEKGADTTTVLSATKNVDPGSTVLKTLAMMESTLNDTAHFYGYDSVQVRAEAKRIVKTGNEAAMKLVDQGEYVAALNVFKRTEASGGLCPGANALTFSNLACAYHKMGRLDVALVNVEAALKAYKSGSAMGRCISLGDIRLNMGVILSEQGRHREALSQVRQAVSLLRQELFEGRPCDSYRALIDCVRWELPPKRLAIFPIAIYNLAVELEHLGMRARALEAYRMALAMSTKLVGKKHATTAILQERLRQAKLTLGEQPRPSGAGLNWICTGAYHRNDRREGSSATVIRRRSAPSITIDVPKCD
ncbi:Protein kinase domain-containing protein [Plasmodiophora brassicae]